MPRIDLDAIEEEWEEDDAPPPPRSGASRERVDLTRYPLGRVIGLHKGWLDVDVDGEELQAVYAGKMRGEQVAVGDRVRVRLPRQPSDTARVVGRSERDTVLLRTADDVLGEERVVVANADLVVVVLASEKPEVGARFVDRVLVAASAGGLDGAVCVNKIDLPGDTSEIVSRYARLGYEVVRTSAVTGEGLEDLGRLIAGRWAVLAGHSGVGKTSLFNRIVPGAKREVGELGRYGGRHTTVSPRAEQVPTPDPSPEPTTGAAETWLVDTPGLRSFGIAHVQSDDLADHFPELRDLDCGLQDCLHDGEPGCRAPALVGETIHPARMESYRRFLTALRGEPLE
ncbi:MAG: ribosome small subunit-dependent GTPase A [Actinomycetota bacterium]|nr:ribosome small subunit-dependent GTPase A [Actinomycetota bacterium]